MPNVTRFFFGVGADPLRGNGADPAAGGVERFDRIRVIDRNCFVWLDHRATPVAVNPFQCVTGDTLAGLAFKNETLKIGIACRPFAVLDLSCHGREFFPRFGRLLVPIFLQEVRPIKENPGIGIEGYRNELAANRIVLNDAGKVGFDLVFFVVLFQVNRMRGSNPLPNHVDLVDIYIRTLRRPILLIDLQRRRRVAGTEKIFNLVSGFLGPLFGKRPVVTSSFASRFAAKPNGDARAKKRLARQGS